MPGRIAVAACVLIILLGPSMAQSGGSAETHFIKASLIAQATLTQAIRGRFAAGPHPR